MPLVNIRIVQVYIITSTPPPLPAPLSAGHRFFSVSQSKYLPSDQGEGNDATAPKEGERASSVESEVL